MQNSKQINHKIYSAVVEYLSDLTFVIIFFTIYNRLPYFQQLLQPQAKDIIYWLAIGYTTLGLPYLILRNFAFRQIYSKSKNKSSLVIEFILAQIPSMLKIFSTSPQNKNFLKFTVDSKTKIALLSVFLKFYYIPIMLSFFIGNLQEVERLMQVEPFNFFSLSGFNNWGYYLILNLIILIDAGIFAFGYIFEARWLKNEIKSVDPYLSGWFFALICYPPFNRSIDMFTLSDNSPTTYFSTPLLFIFLLCAIILYCIYLWATLALWTKSSNLTNRGIIHHGPYRYVRHPAYAAKNIAWWLERLPYIVSWSGFLSMLIWNLIYIMRALTEERHLLADPAYKKYTKKVRFRFIPGLI